MPRCVDCKHFPWKPSANLGLLPSVKCHPDSSSRRWTMEGAKKDSSCPLGVVSELAEGRAESEGDTLTQVDDSYTVRELRKMAGERGVTGTSRMKKSDLIEAINNN